MAPAAEAHAFGIALRFDPGLRPPGLQAPPPGAGAATEVTCDPDGIEREWADAEVVYVDWVGDQEHPALTIACCAGGSYLVSAEGHGRAHVDAAGLCIRCEPDPGSVTFPALLAAQVLPLAATIRGLEVLHASGVVIDGDAYLFAAEPGVGKSSLAARLLLRGAGLLSDDAVAVDAGMSAHTGSKMLHLRSGERSLLTPADLAVLGPQTMLNGRAAFVAGAEVTPARVRCLFLLERTAGRSWITPQPELTPFALLGATFVPSVRTPARLERQLALCQRLAKDVAMFSVGIGPHLPADALAERLLDQVAGASAR